MIYRTLIFLLHNQALVTPEIAIRVGVGLKNQVLEQNFKNYQMPPNIWTTFPQKNNRPI